MMTIAQVATTFQHVLIETATQAAMASGFIKRRRKLTGAAFVQGLVFGFLAHPAATYDQLAQAVGRAGIRISPQGLEQRLTTEAATCLQTVLGAATRVVVEAEQTAASVLQRFAAVWILDTTIIPLPADFATEF